MRTICTVLLLAFSVVAQSIPANPLPDKKGDAVVSIADANDRGTVSGRTYTNHGLGFEITFPNTWLVRDDDVADTDGTT